MRRGFSVPVQDSLAGLEGKPETGSLFFCVLPEPAAREAIIDETDALRVEHSLTGSPVRPNHLHVTLHYLGEHLIDRTDIVDAATAAAAGVRHPPFEVTLARASSFSTRTERHPCVLLFQEERPPIHGLWRELSNRLMAAGFGRYLKRDFAPHVTVLYDTRVLTPQAIEPIRWLARDFALVRSREGEHEIIGNWPLRDS
jgi:RNA 2',3'-cyclic 3'-phosphodiesterase